MLERTEPPTDQEGELDGRRKRKKSPQKTEKPCKVLRTEQEELMKAALGKSPETTWKSKKPHVKGYKE